MASVQGIDISLDQVTAAAASISTTNKNLLQKLQDIEAQISALSQTWQSDAGTTIVAKIKGMDSKFTEYNAVIGSYVSFLTSTVQAYDTTEKLINSNASAFN